MTNLFKLAVRIFTLFVFCFLASDCAANTDEIKIVAFGTSFTNGKGVSRSDAFPAKLELMLRSEGENVQIENKGINGNTTIDLLIRLRNSVPDGVDIVIFEYAFGNDRKNGIAEEDTVRNCEQIISQFVARNIQVLLLIRGKDQDMLQEHIELFSEIIKKYDILYQGIEQPPSSLLYDRQHPTVEAHGQIAANLVPQIKILIERVKAKHK